MNGKNLVFALDPFAFASSSPINPTNMKACNTTSATLSQALAQMGRLDTIRDAHFDLEPVSMASNQVLLRAAFPGTVCAPPPSPSVDPLLHCYWVPYRSHGVQGAGIANVPYVDLPTAAPLYNVMFTGAMNGCSLVITIEPNAVNTIRVFHDSMHQATTFAAANVVARLDFDNSLGSPHFYGDANNPTSFNFMYFKAGHWWVVSQPHTAVAGPTGYSVSLRTTKPPFEFQVT